MNSSKELTEQYLARGGACFTLASITYANGEGASDLVYLSPQYQKCAGQIISVMRRNANPHAMQRALAASLSAEPSTALPPWTQSLLTPANLDAIADALTLPAPLAQRLTCDTDRDTALCLVACAFCRNTDQLQALIAMAPPECTGQMEDAGVLAALCIDPGTPSVLRRQLKEITER